MEVVAAGVHDPVHPAPPGDCHGFADGQGIHVGPEGHHPARTGAVQGGGHPLAGNALLHRKAQVRKICRRNPCGALLFVGQLRVLVEIPAQAHELRGQALGCSFYIRQQVRQNSPE